MKLWSDDAMRRTWCFGITVMLVFLNPLPALAAPPLGDWAFQTMGMIQNHYALSGHLYSQEPDKPAPADLWNSGIQLPALNALSRLNPQRIADAAAYADALDAAWRTNRWGHIAYGPKIPIGNRYYDDNEWVILGLLETYELTHAPRFLERAQTLMQFVASGESTDLGGGIWWRELRRDGKNTCSNAPAICCALRLYHFDHDPKWLALANRLYIWTNKYLQDADGLYFDNVNLQGKIGKSKWSYNTALMIRGNCLFYELTQDKKYLHAAQREADAAGKYFFRSSDGALTNPSQFAHLLCEALLDLSALDHHRERLEKVERALVFLHDHVRTRWGFYPRLWDQQADDDHRFLVMYQASAGRAYAVAADYAKQWH